MDNNTIVPAAADAAVNTNLPEQAAAAAANLNMFDLFWGAEPVVKGVIIVLLLASFWCWSIIFQKFMLLTHLNASAKKFNERFWSSRNIDELYEKVASKPNDPLSRIFNNTIREWKRLKEKTKGNPMLPRETIMMRVEHVLQLSINQENEFLEKHLGFLASTGSTAPFIGLFGTVLGIMHSFQSIAAEQNTNLAVVAPGIAEALFATALGLVAAIPAVIGYNKLTGSIGKYQNYMLDFTEQLPTILSNQLRDEGIE